MDNKMTFQQIISFENCFNATKNLIQKNVLSQGLKGDKRTIELICLEMGLQPSYKRNIEKIRNVFIKNIVSIYKLYIGSPEILRLS